MEIQTIGVVGAGTMGNGVAQVCAAAGFQVVMRDINDAAIERGVAAIAGNLDRLVKKEKMAEAEKTATLAKIQGVTDLRALSRANFIIEAAPENPELKHRVLDEIDGVAKAGVIIATNTSSISITKLAARVSRPREFIGMHFFNPVPLMALVEVIRGIQTSDETFAATEALVKKIGKTPIAVKNAPGFVVNRILVPMINEAVYVLQEGLAPAEEIDTAMKLGASHPIGPLALADLIGLDTCLAIMEVFYRDLSDPKYRPAPLLREMVDAGYLGRKTSRGFYRY